jgi:hypothetical protein
MRCRLFFALALSGVVVVIIVARFSGAMLVLNNAASADVALIQGGDDRSYWQALTALRRGQTKYLLLNIDAFDVDAIDNIDDRARAFVNKSAPDIQDRIAIVPYACDDYEWIDTKLRELNAHSVMLIVPEAESRLRVAEFRHRLPQYQWSSLAVNYPEQFGREWWHKRAWAKRFVWGLTAWLNWQMGASRRFLGGVL